MTSCMIFEDDVTFATNFRERFQKQMTNIPSDTDAIFLNVTENFKPIPYTNDIEKIGGCFFGLHAYIITKSCAQTMLNNIFPIEVQIDSAMSFLRDLNSLQFYNIKGLCGQNPHLIFQLFKNHALFVNWIIKILI